MKNLFLGAILFAGSSTFCFAKSSIETAVKSSNSIKTELISEEEVPPTGCIRCHQSTTTITDENGTTTTTGIQYCYDIPCPKF